MWQKPVQLFEVLTIAQSVTNKSHTAIVVFEPAVFVKAMSVQQAITVGRGPLRLIEGEV